MLGRGWAFLSDWRQCRRSLAGALDLWMEGLRRAGRFVRACFWADRDRWLMWIPVALGLGIAGYFSLTYEPQLSAGLTSVGLVAFAVAAITVMRRRWEERSPELGYAAFVASIFVFTITLGFVVSQLRTLNVAAPVLQREIGPVSLEGWIESAARQPEGDWRLVIAPNRIGNLADQDLPVRVRVSVHQRLAEITPAMGFQVRVMLMPPPGPVSPDGFDFARRAWFERIGAVGYSVSTPDTSPMSRSNGLLSRAAGALRGFRQAIAEHIRSSLPGSEGAIAAALLTGDREAIPDAVVNSLRASGLAHLLAISGLHMTLV